MALSSAEDLPIEESDATQPTPEKIRNPEEAFSPLSESTRVLLAELQNWQVVDPVFVPAADAENEPANEFTAESAVEIEGEATRLPPGDADDARSDYARSGYAPNADSAEPDRAADTVDAVIIAGLPERQVVVKAGSATQLVVSLLNNGNQPADFDVHVEGWVRDGWMPEGKQRIAMQPGERNAVSLIFAPPRDPNALAGEFPLVIVVRSPQYSRRVTRLHATLVIQPYTDFALGKLEDMPSSHGSQKSSLFTLSVTNKSNHPIAVQLHAATVGLACDAAWLDPKADPFQGLGPKKGKASDGWRVNPTVLTLATGEARDLAVRVTPRKAPIFGGKAITASVRVTASVVGEARMPRSATGEFRYAPPIKPWHLGLAAAASVFLLVMSAMGSLGAMLLFGNRAAIGSNSAPIVIVLNQNAPVSAIQSVAKGAVPDANSAAGDPAASAESAPIITADQVTTPDEGSGDAQAQGAASTQPLVVTQPGQGQTGQAQAGQALAAPANNFSAAPGGGAPMVSPADISAPGSQPLVVTQPQGQAQSQVQAAPPAVGGPTQEIVETPTASLTYGQMFQEIALEYDLDWRLLAAQAYVETGLDALALGNDGDMGLMQVLPSTWREWAPSVGAVDPFDAYSNTLVASAYLDYVRGELGRRGYPQAQWMLVGYNWGPDRLVNFLADGGTWEQLPAVRSQYATDILRIARTIP